MKCPLTAAVLMGTLLSASMPARASEQNTSAVGLEGEALIVRSISPNDLEGPLKTERVSDQQVNQQISQSPHSRRKLWVALVPLIAVVAILIWARASVPSD